MAEKVKEQDEGTPGSVETGKPEPAGSSATSSRRPEQKSGEGEDLGQNANRRP